MTVVAISPTARQLFLNPSDGKPASGFLLFTYLSGTTTKYNTYVDSTGMTPNTNPVVLDTLGECDLWLESGIEYTFVFSPPTDTDPPTNAIWTVDGIIAQAGQIVSVTSVFGRTGAIVAEADDYSSFDQVNQFKNASLALSFSGGAMTIALKDAAGNDPSITSPAVFQFHDIAATTGTNSQIKVTAPTSFIVSNGSTLGFANGVSGRVWIVAFNDNATFRLGVINCRASTTIYPLSGWRMASAVAEGGLGAADSAQVFYSGVIISNKPYIILGYASWETGLTTAGTWTAETRLQGYGPGVPLPGEIIQNYASETGAFNSGSTVLPLDATIPQNTEGVQFLTINITPSSASNMLEISTIMNCSHSASSYQVTGALFQDANVNAISSAFGFAGDAALEIGQIQWAHKMVAGTTVQTTFNARAGGNVAGNICFNGNNSVGLLLGGTLNSVISVIEIVA